MTIKDREDQMKMNYSVYMTVSVLLWLVLFIFIGSGLFELRELPTLPLTSISVNVPSLKENNISALRESTRPSTPGSINLPISKAEPFD